MKKFNLIWMDVQSGSTYITDDFGNLVEISLGGAAHYHPFSQVY